jgi:hypothetical protein
MYPLALPWNKRFMPSDSAPKQKLHALWPCPEKNNFMPSGPALKQKFHTLWPCPETKVSCPLALPWKKKFHALWPYPSLYIIDIISSFLTIIIPLKAGCRGAWIRELEILAPRLPQNEREAELALALPACLPNSASRTLLLGQWGCSWQNWRSKAHFWYKTGHNATETKFKVSKVPPP